MALELAPRGIRVNAIAPGSTVTEITRKLFYAEDGSFPRTGRPPDGAHSARPARRSRKRSRKARCSSPRPRAATSTATSLTIDGGWTAGYMM